MPGLVDFLVLTPLDAVRKGVVDRFPAGTLKPLFQRHCRLPEGRLTLVVLVAVVGAWAVLVFWK